VFCTKCGNQINDNEKVCSQCGSKVNSSEFDRILRQIGISGFIESIKNNTTLNNITSVIGVNSIKYFVCIICIFFALLTGLFADFRISSLGFETSAREVQGVDGRFYIFIILLLLVTIINALIPFLFKRKVKRWNFIPSKFVVIVEFLYMVIAHIAMVHSASSSGYGDLAKVSLNSAGYMLYFFSVLSIILCFSLTKKLPKRVSFIKKIMNSYSDINAEQKNEE